VFFFFFFQIENFILNRCLKTLINFSILMCDSSVKQDPVVVSADTLVN